MTESEKKDLRALARRFAERSIVTTATAQLIEQVLTEASDVMASMQWRPIETCPMSATVLVAWPLRKLETDDMPTGPVTRVTVCLGQRTGKDYWDDLGAFEGTGSYFGDEDEPAERPSHWMPLPQPPPKTT